MRYGIFISKYSSYMLDILDIFTEIASWLWKNNYSIIIREHQVLDDEKEANPNEKDKQGWQEYYFEFFHFNTNIYQKMLCGAKKLEIVKLRNKYSHIIGTIDLKEI